MFRNTLLLFLFFFLDISQVKAEKGGMPQLNPESFSSQIFWLTLLFILLFFLNHLIFLPKLEKIRRIRKETINDQLNEAKKINDSINIIVETMKKNFDDAKNSQNLSIKKTFEDNKKIIDQKILEINDDFEKKKEKLNDDIEKNKQSILLKLPNLCVVLSDQLYEKIMGEKIKGDISDFKKLIGEDGK